MRAGSNWTGKGIVIEVSRDALVETRMNGRSGMEYANSAGGNNVSWWMRKDKYRFLCVGRYIIRFK